MKTTALVRVNQSNRRESGNMSERTIRRPYTGATHCTGYCVSCRRATKHVRKVQEIGGRRVAVWVCTEDGTAFKASGLCCRKCGGLAFRVKWVRHRPDAVVRLRICCEPDPSKNGEPCGWTMRTVEREVPCAEASAIPERATGRPI